MNNAPFIALTGYEVSTVPTKVVGVFAYEVIGEGFRETFAYLMEALCYAENVDRARDLSAEALAYFNASGVLVD